MPGALEHWPDREVGVAPELVVWTRGHYQKMLRGDRAAPSG